MLFGPSGFKLFDTLMIFLKEKCIDKQICEITQDAKLVYGPAQEMVILMAYVSDKHSSICIRQG